MAARVMTQRRRHRHAQIAGLVSTVPGPARRAMGSSANHNATSGEGSPAPPRASLRWPAIALAVRRRAMSIGGNSLPSGGRCVGLLHLLDQAQGLVSECSAAL
jgi:hypothetical protein